MPAASRRSPSRPSNPCRSPRCRPSALPRSSGAQIREVRVLAEIFLGDLELEHERRLRHRAEQRMRTVRAAESRAGRSSPARSTLSRNLSVERLELVVRLLDAILRGDFVAVDERAPHHDAAVRRQRVGQHVRAVGVRALVVLRSGLTFGVRFHDEAAEVGNDAIDLVGLRSSTTRARRDRADRRSSVRRSRSAR